MPDKELSYKEFLEQQGELKRPIVRAEEATTVAVNKKAKKKRKKKMVSYTTEREFDFLKYYIIVEHYALKVMFAEYNLQAKDLKFLLFLYSEPPFTRTDFLDYQELLKWNKFRLNEWLDNGLIEDYKPIIKGNRQHYSKARFYKLSRKANRLIRSLYDKLVLRYKITEHDTHNPLFRARVRTYTDKRYAKKIKQMNNGDFNKRKTDDDYYDMDEISFKEFCDEYNKNNNETLPPDMKTVDDLAKQKKK